MRAVQIDRYGSPDVLCMTDVETPSPEPGALRIRTVAVGVNPADVKWRQGMFADMVPIRFPHILGYDVAGKVEALGSGVTGFAIGDRVFAMLDPVSKGGYAERCVVPADRVVALPDAVDFVTAAALPTPALTGLQLIDEHVRPASGETVLLTGAVGAVGRFALFAVRRRGARVVAAVRESQIGDALALGADRAIVLDDGVCQDIAFDHVADTVGGPAVVRLCRLLPQGGRIRTVATTPIDPAGLPAEPGFIAVHPDPAGLTEVAGLVQAGIVTLPIARRLPLSEAALAHRLVEAGGSGGRIVLEV